MFLPEDFTRAVALEAARRAPAAKASPDADDVRRIRAARAYVRASEGGGGRCSVMSEILSIVFGWPMMSGTYLSSDGKVICGDGHVWNILPDGSFLDPTADQFGEGHDVRVVRIGTPEHRRYRIGIVDDGSFEDLVAAFPVLADIVPDGFDDMKEDERLDLERGPGWWLADRSARWRYACESAACDAAARLRLSDAFAAARGTGTALEEEAAEAIVKVAEAAERASDDFGDPSHQAVLEAVQDAAGKVGRLCRALERGEIVPAPVDLRALSPLSPSYRGRRPERPEWEAAGYAWVMMHGCEEAEKVFEEDAAPAPL